MGDDDQGLHFRHIRNRLEYALFGGSVECACRFVKYEHRRIVIQGASDPDPLTLPTTEAHASLSNRGLIAVRKRCKDEVMDIGDLRCALYRPHVNLFIGNPQGDVASDGVVGQIDLLRHIPKIPLPAPQVLIGDLCSIYVDAATGKAKQAQDQVDGRGLAGTGPAGKSD